MNQNPRHPITLKPVLFTLPGMDAVTVRSIGFPSADEAALLMDLYAPSGRSGAAPLPVVVIVPGYPDEGAQRILGCRQKEMAAVVSWAKLIAASGMAAIACENRVPAVDLDALLVHVAANASGLGVDALRIGLWACSGHVPVALSALMRGARVRPACASFCYGYTMDLDGSTEVADAAKTFGFENACAGLGIDDLVADVPLFVARAGRDEMPGLNVALDRFVAAVLTRNAAIELINYPEGPHAFDVMEESARSHEVIRRVLAFLTFHLRAAPARGE
jgi:acetyl esterase/lipase